MRKPAGYTQEMIDAVVGLERMYGDGNHSFALRDGIFDLILAAEKRGEEREREACLNEISIIAGTPIQPQSALAHAYSAIKGRGE